MATTIRLTGKALRAKALTGTATARQLGTLRRLARATGTSLASLSKNESPEQKAIWHHVTGAGRNRIRRPFFDLNDPDLTALAALLQRRIDARLDVIGTRRIAG